MDVWEPGAVYVRRIGPKPDEKTVSSHQCWNTTLFIANQFSEIEKMNAERKEKKEKGRHGIQLISPEEFYAERFSKRRING